MSSYIFLDDETRGLVPMREQRYENEALLQSLVERYPELLNDDADTDAGRRALLLVRREASLEDSADGAATFSVDHHFVDAVGIPTLVEVKRSQDTRNRRSVIGQMLDYAARSVVEWDGESTRRDYERTCAKDGREPANALAELIGEDADPEAFWATVHENLRQRRIRLVLVSDEIPSSTRRVIEYLNAEMVNTEVIGIEIKRYIDPITGLSALVPRPLAVSERVKAQKAALRSGTDQREWNRARLLEALQSTQDTQAMEVAKQILAHADSSTWHVKFSGPGTKGAARIDVGSIQTPVQLLHIYVDGSVAIAFDQLQRNAPIYASDERRMALLDRLEDVTGVDLKNRHDGGPRIRLETLASPHVLTAFLELVDSVSRELRT